MNGPAEIRAMEGNTGRWSLWLMGPLEGGMRRHDRYGRKTWATQAEAMASVGR